MLKELKKQMRRWQKRKLMELAIQRHIDDWIESFTNSSTEKRGLHRERSAGWLVMVQQLDGEAA